MFRLAGDPDGPRDLITSVASTDAGLVKMLDNLTSGIESSDRGTFVVHPTTWAAKFSVCPNARKAGISIMPADDRMTPSTDDEEQRLLRASGSAPDSAQAHAALASFLCAAGRAEEALVHLDRQAHRLPASLWPLSIKAGVLSNERRTKEALDVHRSLVAAAPNIALLWANFAEDLAAMGERAESGAAFRKAIALAPEFGAAWLGLANLRDNTRPREDIAAMEQALPAAHDPYQRVQMLFALGRAYAEHDDFEKSFDYFRSANMLRETLRPYDPVRITELADAYRALPPSFFARLPKPTPNDENAIFIVGMPRAGSTLVEQILAGHPDIDARGELFVLPEVAASVGASASPSDFTSRIASLAPAEAEQLGRRYLAGARRFRTDERRFFTDKLPANWQLVPLLLRIVPGARIIDVRRDPLACCFSAYTTYFNRHTDFPNELRDLARYYRSYADVMDGMQRAVPERIYRLNYERLVRNPEPEVSALLAFLRLPFAPACLSPHENSRAIYTPSAQQVRAPIGVSQDYWRNYLAWLGPLKIEFGR